MGSIQISLVVAHKIVDKLDQTQYCHALSQKEIELHSLLKIKCSGLASLAHTIARQKSRHTFLADSDANTKFFHLQDSHRGRKNFIDQFEHQGSLVVDKALKGQVVFDHFDAILGNAEPWLHGLLLHWLGLPYHSLAVDQCFLEEEIWSIINAMPPIRPRVLATSLEDFT
jgi:hypothetical protein